ncbi:DEAD/DEAH box helicase family protein [Oleispirillum naphthae]|uniref:DEAD/DEAH box helicase family protein n=1 Tax=Oleispirillum naphthae TaxID=2838853 RepID=UPI00308224AD
MSHVQNANGGDSQDTDAQKLRTLNDAKPLYFIPNDNLIDEVLVPAFQEAQKASCMVGFFSSAVLASLAPGLATYINSTTSTFRLIVSPFLRIEDMQALKDGTARPEVLAKDALEQLLVTEDLLRQHTLRCLAYLLHAGRLEVQIALMEDALFHPKVWIFEAGKDAFAAHGSSNMTNAGIARNFEQVTISKSWVDPTQNYIIEKLRYQFSRLWENKEDNCVVVSLPTAIKDKILRAFSSEYAPTEDECRALYAQAMQQSVPQPEVPMPDDATPVRPKPSFSIPAWLKFDEGPFEHQGRAIRAWCDAGFRGVLEMATGSGKTLTSMIGAYRLFETASPLLIVVAAPYIPLIQQWCDEIESFGVKPVNLTTVGNAAARSRVLQQVKRRLRLSLSQVEVVVISHDTLCSQEFHDAVGAFDCARLLVADEAHNLGREAFVSHPPDFFEHRLALSATPVRQYDPDGTDAIFAFFGDVVFRFTLEEAIGRCLVEYDYYLCPVTLTATEMDAWYELTVKIKQNTWRQGDGAPDEYLTKLYRDRRALLETAHGKIDALRALLNKEDLKTLKHTLIYATDKGPAQLSEVNRALLDNGVLFHQLTSEETHDRENTARIIRSFQEGELQVLTAKRVLDEGVNIPQICKAFILASTTVERQWIQRRGRLLRTCRSIGKTYSVIYDFLALPPLMGESLDKEARALIRSELRRAQEFASLARNAGKPDGPLPVIDQLVNAAFGE